MIVFVEMDRCATDAVQSVTGCSLGHRTMKFMDYGKMAATFVNLKTRNSRPGTGARGSREKAHRTFLPDIPDKYQAQLEAYKIMPEEALFDCAWRSPLALRPEDMPGRPLRRFRAMPAVSMCRTCGRLRETGRSCAGPALKAVIISRADCFLEERYAEKS